MPGIQTPFPKAQLSVGLGQMATLRLGNLISLVGSALSLRSPLHWYPALGLRPLTQMRKVIQGEAQDLGDLASIELPSKVGGGEGVSQGFFKEGGLFRMCINCRDQAASTGWDSPETSRGTPLLLPGCFLVVWGQIWKYLQFLYGLNHKLTHSPD